MSNSTEYFIPLQELSIDTTLGIIPPTNPLKTTQSVENNLVDPVNTSRIDIMNAMIVLDNTVTFPSSNPLDPATANYIMCWLINNFQPISNQISSWAEDLKYGLTNCDDKNDTDLKTNHKYKLFLEYGTLFLERYYSRTRESPLVDNLLFTRDSHIKELYYKCRQNYFQKYYNDLRVNQFNKLFTNSVNTSLGSISCGWLDLKSIAIANIFTQFRKLTVDTTYSGFLASLDTLITNCHNFLISDGNLSQFVLTTYPIAPFYGQNTCKFDDKLKCIYEKFENFPNYLQQLNRYPDINAVSYSPIGSPSLTQYYTDYKIDWFQITQNNRSIISCLCGILINFIMHLFDKFIPYYQYPLDGATPPPPPPNDRLNQTLPGILSGNGAQFLQCLLFYFIGVKNFIITGGAPQFTSFRGLFQTFSFKNSGLTDSEVEFILGAPDDTGAQVTGILRYVISKLTSFLNPTAGGISTTLKLRTDTNVSSTPTYLLFTEVNFYCSFLNINWNDTLMQDSLLNFPPAHSITGILQKTPANICVGSVTLEKEILNLLDSSTLEGCFKSFISTHLNIIEGLNIPTNIVYFTPSVTTDLSGNIISYDSLSLVNIFEKITFVGSCPSGVLNINFFSENNFINPNLINIKYYVIAIINYMLFGILRQINFGDLLPPLDLTSIAFPYNQLKHTPYKYEATNSDTIQLMYQTYIWHTFLYSSFFGSGEFFDPINLPNQTVCSTLTNTGLVNNMFYLEWKYNQCYLNDISESVLTNLYDLIAEASISLPPPKPIPFIPYERIANLERVTFVNTTRPSLF